MLEALNYRTNWFLLGIVVGSGLTILLT